MNSILTTSAPAKVTVINRPKLFNSVRKTIFSGKLIDLQVQGIEAILNEWEKQQLKDLRWLAYMFATVYHETATTMQPIAEYGKGKGHDYGQKLKMGGGRGKRIPYSLPNEIFYGRGLIQLTWFENYQLMGRLLGIDLLNHPGKAMEMDIAVRIMFEGMMRASSSFGDFTGRSLEQYFNLNTEDWIKARYIINCLDCAEAIAQKGKIFYAALSTAA